MAETLIVTLIVLAAAAHVGYRYLIPRRWLRKSGDDTDSGCRSGCGSGCGGCPAAHKAPPPHR